MAETTEPPYLPPTAVPPNYTWDHTNQTFFRFDGTQLDYCYWSNRQGSDIWDWYSTSDLNKAQRRNKANLRPSHSVLFPETRTPTRSQTPTSGKPKFEPSSISQFVFGKTSRPLQRAQSEPEFGNPDDTATVVSPSADKEQATSKKAGKRTASQIINTIISTAQASGSALPQQSQPANPQPAAIMAQPPKAERKFADITPFKGDASDRHRARTFFSECRMQLTGNQHIYDTDTLKVFFVYTQMKEGPANTWAFNRRNLAETLNPANPDYGTFDQLEKDFYQVFVSPDFDAETR